MLGWHCCFSFDVKQLIYYCNSNNKPSGADLQQYYIPLTYVKILIEKAMYICIHFINSLTDQKYQICFCEFALTAIEVSVSLKKRDDKSLLFVLKLPSLTFWLWIKQHTQHLLQTQEQFIYFEIIRNDGRLKKKTAEGVME